MASENNLTLQPQKYFFNTSQQHIYLKDFDIAHCDYCCHSRKFGIPLKSKSLQASPTQTPVATRKSSRSHNSINSLEEVLSYGSADELLRHRLTRNLQANEVSNWYWKQIDYINMQKQSFDDVPQNRCL